MSENRPWREVKAEKQRRDAERGRTPIRAYSNELADARPRYRVHATRWYDHDELTECRADDGTVRTYGHQHSFECTAGWYLEVYALQVDDLYPPEQRVGATQTNTGETFSVPTAKALVIDYLRTLAHPHVISVLPSQITFLVETP